MTLERYEALLERILPAGKDAAKARRILLNGAKALAAHMVEEHARSDERWGPQ